MTEKTFEEFEKEVEVSINWKSASYLMWTGINIIWWFISVKSDIDVNPFLDDTFEFSINIIVFGIGLIIIYFYFKKKKEEVENEKE